mmetsp:Transcript_70270/g.168375  ORF Transcript_70270/g.168375 Transcript_70270/m.168375 type:complete len:576 (+) Transcript_70270:117-1844(+)
MAHLHRETVRVVTTAEEGEDYITEPVATSAVLSPRIHATSQHTTVRMSTGGMSLHEESPPSAASILMPSRMDEAVDTALQAAQRRQSMWDQQLESVDQKQAELLTIQWKLIREQVGTIGREVALIQNEVKDLKADSRKAVLEVERHVRDIDTKVDEERVMRTTLCEGLEGSIHRLKADISNEAKMRVAGDKEVSAKMDHFTEELDKLARKQALQEQEMLRMQSEVNAALQQCDAVRDALAQEGNERKVVEANLLDRLGELRRALLNESQDRATADEEMLRGLRDLIEKERAERNADLVTLRTSFSSMQKDFFPGKDEIASLGNRLADLEATFMMQLKDMRDAANKDTADNLNHYGRLEKRILEISKTLEKEGASRAALAEETEQMLKTFRVKMRAQLNEQAEAARMAREALQRALQDQLDKEISAREAQGDALSSDLAAQRVALQSKLEAMQKLMNEIEAKNREMMAKHVLDWEQAHSKLLDDLGKQIRDVRETLTSRLNEERLMREASDGSIEEHLEFLDRFLQDVRELFMQKGTWQRKLIRKPATASASIAVTSTAHRSIVSSQAASPIATTP